MEQISFFLEKFKSLGLGDIAAKTALVESVEKILKVKIPVSSVTLRNGIFFVSAHPALKSELYLGREAILVELEKTLGSECKKSIR